MPKKDAIYEKWGIRSVGLNILKAARKDRDGMVIGTGPGRKLAIDALVRDEMLRPVEVYSFAAGKVTISAGHRITALGREFVWALPPTESP